MAPFHAFVSLPDQSDGGGTRCTHEDLGFLEEFRRVLVGRGMLRREAFSPEAFGHDGGISLGRSGFDLKHSPTTTWRVLTLPPLSVGQTEAVMNRYPPDMNEGIVGEII